MNKNVLERLINSHDIVGYSHEIIDDNGDVISEVKSMQCKERITIVFQSGISAIFESVCSGCLENTHISVSVSPPDLCD